MTRSTCRCSPNFQAEIITVTVINEQKIIVYDSFQRKTKLSYSIKQAVGTFGPNDHLQCVNYVTLANAVRVDSVQFTETQAAYKTHPWNFFPSIAVPLNVMPLKLPPSVGKIINYRKSLQIYPTKIIQLCKMLSF